MHNATKNVSNCYLAQILLPGRITETELHVQRYSEVVHILGPRHHWSQTHSGLFQIAAALLVVAARAGGGKVFPGILASLTTRSDMVESQRDSLAVASAKATGIAVAMEDIASRRRQPELGHVDITLQTNH